MTTEAERRAAVLRDEPFRAAGTPHQGPFRGFVSGVSEVWRRRDLLGLLVRRELKSRFKDSRLGFLWSLARPIMQFLIYFVVIGQFLGAARGTPQFAVFVFAGLTIWSLCSETVVTSTKSLIQNAGLIKKVYVPRTIFPLASIGSSLFNVAVQFGVLIVVILVLGQFPLNWNLLYVPAAIVVALIWGVGISLMLSALNVFLRDIQYLVEVLVLVLFWASPIVYPWAFVVNTLSPHLQWLEWVYLANPITMIVLAFQRGIWEAGSLPSVINGADVPPQPWPADMPLWLLVLGLVGLVVVWIGQRVFARLEGNFAQEI